MPIFRLRFVPRCLVAAAVLFFLVGCSAERPARGLPVATLLGPQALPLVDDDGRHHHGPKAVPKLAKVRPPRRAHAGPQQPMEGPVEIARAHDLLISEVMADPLLLDDAVGEYVEVVYLGAEPASVRGVELLLPDGRTVAIRADPMVSRTKSRRGAGPARATRATRKSRAHGKGPGVIEHRSSRKERPGDVLQPGQVLVVRSTRSQRLRLPNRAGRLELRRGSTVLDVMQWTAKWPWPKHRAGRALCRRSADADGRQGRSWRRCKAQLRGLERGSPGRVVDVCRWLRRRNTATMKCAAPVTQARAERRGLREP